MVVGGIGSVGGGGGGGGGIGGGMSSLSDGGLMLGLGNVWR